MRRLALTLLLLAAAALGGCDLGGDDRSDKTSAQAAPGSATSQGERPSRGITRAELEHHLAALQRIADRNGGTRAAGTPGYDRSADYVAARLEDAGWRVTRQDVPFTYFRLNDASLAIGGRGVTQADDFQGVSYSRSRHPAGGLPPPG